jgi:large subunit ribosomal protein L23
MIPSQVVKQPLVTEKATWEAGRHNRYAFEVDQKANKHQIARAVQTLYEVRVRRVRTQNRKGRNLRNRFGIGRTSDWKKAVVELHPEDRIEVM